MATCYKRTWQSGKVSWYTKVKDASGEWKPLHLKGVKNEAQAQKLANEIEKERERAGHGLPSTSLFLGTFAELCAWAWKIHFSKQGSAQADGSRFKTHAGDVEQGTSTWLGALPVRKVTGPLLAKYFAEMAEMITVRGKPYSAGAINRYRAQLSTVFELAKEHGYWMGDNPVAATSARPVVQGSHDILEAHEIKPVLDATPAYWRGCLALGILAGLRKGEIFGLEKRDVDLEGRVLKVRRSHGRQTTKGGTHKPVPIHEDLVPYLEEWLKTPGPMLFPNKEGKRRSHQVDLPRIVQAALVKAGFIDRWEYKCRRRGCGALVELPHGESHPERRDCPECGFRLWPTPRARHIVWHEATRHTLASHAIMSGASIASVQAILRHADPRLTINTYGHLSAGFLGAEVNRVSVPGLTKGSDTEQSGAILDERMEHPPRPAHRPRPTRGARMVRGDGAAHQRAGAKRGKQHENSLESEWSRGVSNSGPMHCECKGGVSEIASPLVTPSQACGNAHSAVDLDSTPLPPVASLPTGRGAPMVRETEPTHHGRQSAYEGGSGRNPDDLLTLKQVSERLQVGRMWVRRRLESGDLTGVRLAPAAPLMIDRRELEAYLARFPGILPPEPPASPEQPSAPAPGARKGAA